MGQLDYNITDGKRVICTEPMLKVNPWWWNNYTHQYNFHCKQWNFTQKITGSDQNFSPKRWKLVLWNSSILTFGTFSRTKVRTFVLSNILLLKYPPEIIIGSNLTAPVRSLISLAWFKVFFRKTKNHKQWLRVIKDDNCNTCVLVTSFTNIPQMG